MNTQTQTQSGSGRWTLAAAVIAATLASAGCGGGGVTMREPVSIDRYATLAGPEINVLTVNQTRLALPPGWIFVRSDEKPVRGAKASMNVFFKFKEPSERAQGFFGYVHYDIANVDPERLLDVHVREALSFISNREVYPTVIDGKPARIVTGQNDKGLDVFVGLVPEGSNLNTIFLLAGKGYLFDHPEIAYGIFRSYSFAAKDLGERRRDGTVGFKSTDGTWSWAFDWDVPASRGVAVAGMADAAPVVAAVGRTTLASLEDVRRTFQKADLRPEGDPIFVGSATIAGRTTHGQGAWFRNDSGVRMAMYLLEADDQKYLVSLTVADDAGVGGGGSPIERPGIRAFLADNVRDERR